MKVKHVGIYNPYIDSRGGGERICLALAETLAELPNVKISIITHKPVQLHELGEYFQIDLSKIENSVINFQTPFMKFISRLPIPGGLRNFFHDLRTLNFVKQAGFDVFVNNCYQSKLPNPTKYGVYMCMFPYRSSQKGEQISLPKRIYKLFLELLNRVFLSRGAGDPIGTYQLITANSAFTQSFITKWWGRESKILYPYGEDFADPKVKKEKIILEVGRFFENISGSHHKRHDFLVDEFVTMTDLHRQGWELHLAGSVAEDTGTLRYLLDLIKKSAGYPVHFHFNAPYKDLKKLFAQASIYWHATGYGSDPDKKPEKQEHFGITTVEAMSTGAIPVVINAAGQRESVIDGQNGFLWLTPKQMREQTKRVINLKPSELKKMRDAARKRFHRYDQVAFKRLVRRIFSEAVS